MLNHVVVDKIAKGAPVMTTNITDNTSTGQTGLSVDIIPANFVAESVAVTEANSVAGNIQVGDFVDVLLSEPPLKATAVPSGTAAPQQPANATPTSQATAVEETTLITQTTLQHVQVIAVGTKSVAGNAPAQSGQQPTTNVVPTSLTLLLSHQYALILKHLKDVGFQVDLVLRNNKDTKADTVTTPVTRDYIDTKFGFNIHTPTAGAAPK